tara:strand:+ start:8099 stop:8518 length:420 start_codon:yes stop_codon:yes gene_type:complete
MNYTGSTNIQFDFPVIIGDGSKYESWQPGAETNKIIRKNEGIVNNMQYRKYLIANSDKIIKTNQMEACGECCGNTPQFGSGKKINDRPFLYKSCNENAKPHGYETSDLKNIYMTRHQLQSTQVTPVLTQEYLFKHHYKR